MTNFQKCADCGETFAYTIEGNYAVVTHCPFCGSDNLGEL